MIQYGGKDLIMPSAQLSAWIEANISPRSAFAFYRWQRLQDRDLDPRQQLGWFLDRPVRINSLYYPWGASRWGVFYGLATGTAVASLREQAYEANAYAALTLTIDDENLDPDLRGEVETDMWMLPPVPLSEFDPEDAALAAATENLYLLVLVDDRFFWWERAGAVSSRLVENTTAWGDLYDAIEEVLGVEIDRDDVSTEYLAPGAALWRGLAALVDDETTAGDNVPVLLDWVASSCGQRIIRDLDGTFSAISATTGKARADSQVALLDKVAGSTLDLSTDALANLPATVSVSFPTMASRQSKTYEASDASLVQTAYFRIVDVEVATLGITGLSVGRGGAHQVASSAVAPMLLGNHAIVNYVEVGELASRIATEWCRWRFFATVEVRYCGALAWDPDGLHDVEWTVDGQGVRTSVHRSEWETDQGELQHASQFGSSAGPQYQQSPVIRVVDGTASGGKHDAVVEPRVNDSQEFLDPDDVSVQITDPSAVWGLEVNGVASVANDSLFPATYVGIEPGGTTYISVQDDNTGNALDDEDWWIPVVGDVLPEGFAYPAEWDETADYVVGNVVRHNDVDYACILDNLDAEPPDATYWVELDPVVDRVGYATDVPFALGNYVQVVRATQAFAASATSSRYVTSNAGYSFLPDAGVPDWEETVVYRLHDVVATADGTFMSIILGDNLGNEPPSPEWQDVTGESLVVFQMPYAGSVRGVSLPDYPQNTYEGLVNDDFQVIDGTKSFSSGETNFGATTLESGALVSGLYFPAPTAFGLAVLTDYYDVGNFQIEARSGSPPATILAVPFVGQTTAAMNTQVIIGNVQVLAANELFWLYEAFGVAEQLYGIVSFQTVFNVAVDEVLVASYLNTLLAIHADMSALDGGASSGFERHLGLYAKRSGLLFGAGLFLGGDVSITVDQIQDFEAPAITVGRETPSGVIDGANDTFMLAHAPNPASSLNVNVNGVPQAEGAAYQFTLHGSVIIFNAAAIPLAGDVIVVSYQYQP